MLRALFGVSLILALAGCASAPKPQVQHSYTKSAKIVQPVEATTPNQIVKKRWYDRFKTHPKWFH